MNWSLLRPRGLRVLFTAGFTAFCLVLPTFGEDGSVTTAEAEDDSKIESPAAVASEPESTQPADPPAPAVIQTSSERPGAEPEHPLGLMGGLHFDLLEGDEVATVIRLLCDDYTSMPMRARPYFSLAATFGIHEVFGHFLKFHFERMLHVRGPQAPDSQVPGS